MSAQTPTTDSTVTTGTPTSDLEAQKGPANNTNAPKKTCKFGSIASFLVMATSLNTIGFAFKQVGVITNISISLAQLLASFFADSNAAYEKIIPVTFSVTASILMLASIIVNMFLNTNMGGATLLEMLVQFFADCKDDKQRGAARFFTSLPGTVFYFAKNMLFALTFKTLMLEGLDPYIFSNNPAVSQWERDQLTLPSTASGATLEAWCSTYNNLYYHSHQPDATPSGILRSGLEAYSFVLFMLMGLNLAKLQEDTAFFSRTLTCFTFIKNKLGSPAELEAESLETDKTALLQAIKKALPPWRIKKAIRNGLIAKYVAENGALTLDQQHALILNKTTNNLEKSARTCSGDSDSINPTCTNKLGEKVLSIITDTIFVSGFVGVGGFAALFLGPIAAGLFLLVLTEELLTFWNIGPKDFLADLISEIAYLCQKKRDHSEPKATVLKSILVKIVIAIIAGLSTIPTYVSADIMAKQLGIDGTPAAVFNAACAVFATFVFALCFIDRANAFISKANSELCSKKDAAEPTEASAKTTYAYLEKLIMDKKITRLTQLPPSVQNLAGLAFPSGVAKTMTSYRKVNEYQQLLMYLQVITAVGVKFALNTTKMEFEPAANVTVPQLCTNTSALPPLPSNSSATGEFEPNPYTVEGVLLPYAVILLFQVIGGAVFAHVNKENPGDAFFRVLANFLTAALVSPIVIGMIEAAFYYGTDGTADPLLTSYAYAFMSACSTGAQIIAADKMFPSSMDARCGACLNKNRAHQTLNDEIALVVHTEAASALQATSILISAYNTAEEKNHDTSSSSEDEETQETHADANANSSSASSLSN